MNIDNIPHQSDAEKNVQTLKSLKNDAVDMALSALRGGHSLPEGWRTEYTKTDFQTDVELCVRSPNGMGWYWSAFDAETEDWITSSPPGFETKEAAMEAAETWYAAWKARFQATGKREFDS